MSRFDRKDVVPVVIMIAVAIAAVIAIAIFLDRSTGVYAAEQFDHSDCQYPTRSSNPPNGCDNSDPAVPECVSPKISDEQACIKEYVAAHTNKDVLEPNSQIQSSPAGSHAAEISPTVVNCTESK